MQDGNGTGNVFRDLGLTEPEMRLRQADLASRALVGITTRFATEADRASHLGITVEAFRELGRGHLDGFAEEELEHLARRALA